MNIANEIPDLFAHRMVVEKMQKLFIELTIITFHSIILDLRIIKV
jgi:hypothetical protein